MDVEMSRRAARAMSYADPAVDISERVKIIGQLTKADSWSDLPADTRQKLESWEKSKNDK
jgi:hypothetical protein